MINPDTKKLIDSMSYTELLRRWRHAKMDDPIFTGESGDYYKKVMDRKAGEIPHAERVSISKMIGW